MVEKRYYNVTQIVLILFLAVCLLGLFVPADTYAAKSQPQLTDATIPGDMAQGSPFTVKGTVTCSSGLSAVEVGVVNADTGKWVSSAHRTVKTSGKSYDLHNVDQYMAFRGLEVGEYYYKIKATDSSGSSKVLTRTAFSVYGKSSFTLKNNPYPTTLTQGKGFNVEGTVTSANLIKKIRVGVVFKSSGNWVKAANATDYKKLMDLEAQKAALDASLEELYAQWEELSD